MGARPMNRLIQDEIKKPLAEQILFGDLVNGGTVSIRMNADKTAIELVPIDEKQVDNV